MEQKGRQYYGMKSNLREQNEMEWNRMASNVKYWKVIYSNGMDSNGM